MLVNPMALFISRYLSICMVTLILLVVLCQIGVRSTFDQKHIVMHSPPTDFQGPRERSQRALQLQQCPDLLEHTGMYFSEALVPLFHCLKMPT